MDSVARAAEMPAGQSGDFGYRAATSEMFVQAALQPRLHLRGLTGQQRKRLFDCTITLLAAPLWLPVLAVCALLILLLEGRPVFYISPRQVAAGRIVPVYKFRTMRRNADKLLNRDTIPVDGVGFLNIGTNSPAYTSIGRLIERVGLTELPQLLHVLSGDMSLIGSRPLPARVMEVLRSRHPKADERFLSKAGLTGPVQLVGRDLISDADRLSLEVDYCLIAAADDYRMWLDLWLLLYTVFIVAVPGQLLSVAQVRRAMYRIASRTPWGYGGTDHVPAWRVLGRLVGFSLLAGSIYFFFLADMV